MNVSQCLFFPVAKFPISRGLVISSGIGIGLNIVMACIAVIGNTLVIMAICRTKELRSNSNTLILFLAITDQLVGVLVQPLFITFELITILKMETNCNVVVVYTLTRALCSILSLTMVLLISLERSLVIFKALQYSTMVSKGRLLILVCIIWIFWTLIVSSRLFGMKTKHFRILVSSVIIICHISTGITYLRIQRLASKHLKNIKAQFSSADNRNTFTRHYTENKALRTTMIITGCVFVCYAPLIGVLVANIAMGPSLSASTSHIMFTWADTMVFLNSSLNPLIYCLRNAEFRRGIKNVLRMKDDSLDDNNLDRNHSRSTTTIEAAVTQIDLSNPVLLQIKYLGD